MSTNLRNTVATQQTRQENAPVSIATFIQQMQPEIARALPAHLDANRISRIILTVVHKTPKLMDCTRDSFAGAILTAASLGLEVGNGEAYLVPYGKECQFIPGYLGLAKLFWQHPLAKHLDAQPVYELDDFDYAYGLDPFLRHKPSAEVERGQIICYYAVAKLTTGASAFVVLTPAQIKELRKGAEGPSGKIADPMHWMERKTCIRQLTKLLPKSSDFSHAIEADEQPGRQLYKDMVVERKVLEATPASDPAPAGVDTSTGEVPPDYEPMGDVPVQDTPEEPWGK